jgi:DNA-binding CsgD family transcriptional regulator
MERIMTTRGRSPVQPYREGPLASSDYERILEVLGACAGTSSPTALRERLLESLASRFGYRHSSVLLGATRGRIFQDSGALTLGRPDRLVPAYIEHYHRWDPLAQLVARRGVTAAGCTLVLDQTRPYLTAENQLYLDRHLYRNGLHAVLCTEGAAQSVHLGLAVFDEREGAFGARDVAVMQRLGSLLTRQAELLTRLPPSPAWAASLSRREAEVARLVSRGCTNQHIAQALHITTDTVKKHVKAACTKAGSTNRAGLAAAMAALDARL